MRERIFNRTTLSGIGAWILSVLPYFQEGSQMNLTTWALLFIGTFLVLWGVLKPEKHISFNDKKAIIAERQEVIPKLKLSIDTRIRMSRQLINRAEKLPLIQYWEKYLRNTMPYLITKNKPTKPLEIVNKLAQKGFVWNNLYYQELKENDASYKQILENYKLNLSKVNDNKLTQKLSSLWELENISHSTQIYASLSMNNKKIPNVPLGYRWGLRGKHNSEKGFQSSLKDVENRINELLRGDDL